MMDNTKLKTTLGILEAAATKIDPSEADLAVAKQFLREAAGWMAQGYTPELSFQLAQMVRLAKIEARLNGEGMN